jgi:20S proteasome subunit beta 1
MSFAEAREFVIRSVSLAMFRDGSSGGVVRLMNVTKDANTREFIPHSELPYK